MGPLVIERAFRVWHYGVGHMRLVLHSYARPGEPESFSVLIVGVRAMQLQTGSYRPLILERADAGKRAELLDLAAVPERFQARMLCLTLPDQDRVPGWIVCSSASLYANPSGAPNRDARAFENSRLVRTLRATESPGPR